MQNRKNKNKEKVKYIIYFLLAFAITFPWLIIRFSAVRENLSPAIISSLSGLCILGAAFILSWTAEAAEKDFSQALALAFLALVAVLPEYGVDMYLAWKAGKNIHYAHFAVANMTGANRLLIGVAWPLMVFTYFIKKREKEIVLEKSQTLEIRSLTIATLYSFIIPIKGYISIFDGIVFISIYIFYIHAASHAKSEEFEVEGPSELITQFNKKVRIFFVFLLFVFSALCIYLSAEAFAEGLIHLGKNWGIEEFLLVQWLAPFASEAPEVIVAMLFVLKLRASRGMGALISSKVNQWTLLVGMLPLAFAISAGKFIALPLDNRQVEEMLLTSAQSIFAICVLINFNLHIKEGVALISLFALQLLFPSPHIRFIFAFAYIFFTVVLLFIDKNRRKCLQEIFLRT